MKNSFKFILIIFVLVIAASCGSKKSGTTIGGTISDGGNLTVFIDKLELQAKEVIDKTEASANGNFSINFPEGLEKGLYRIRAGAKSANIIVSGEESEIKINGSMSDFDNVTYTVIGSKLTDEYLSTMAQFLEIDPSSEEVKNTILSKEPLLALLLALKTLPLSPEYGEAHMEIASYISKDEPDLALGSEYLKIATSMNTQYKMMMASQKVRVGEVAPDIAMEGPDGKIRKLSDLRGKVVLLDFWASWCGPCRRENPNVVRTYDKYKDKGFTVFSVSLDGLDAKSAERMGDENRVNQYMESSKQRWLSAIEKDNLKWDHHVSDLKKWDSVAAAEYGVRSIPKTFLIDRDGTIAALNPRRDLEEQLLKLL